MARRLLILKCSARKRGDTMPIPAIDRYDGPLWQVLRSFVRAQPLFAAEIDVYVLSAAFGLIPATQAIPWYDQTMAPERADALRPAVLKQFDELMSCEYHALCLGLSQRYLRAMQGWAELVPPSITVTQTDGPMGTKLGQLRAWLEDRMWSSNSDRPTRLRADAQPRGHAVVGGVTLQLAREEVLAIARTAMENDPKAARSYRDWYVVVDGKPVAPKWLVSLISGLPTSAFDASAARRVLLTLGIDIERVTTDTSI